MCGESFKKLSGAASLDKLVHYIERTAQMGTVQLMAAKGIPTMAFAIKTLLTKIHMAYEFKLNIGVHLADLDAFFYHLDTVRAGKSYRGPVRTTLLVH